ncbi:ROK family protein [Ilumatobacter nonamiensis]|uniref:ROK family protein n=1 Tax=Ilumatobacter nonamiensis TaxID=467093 RepID=UPI0003496299|nr:ROK family protein [Ilumatobacter nonamiensis]
MRVGIDIGGTKIEAVSIDDELNVLATFRQPVRTGPTGITAGTLEAIDAVSRDAGGRIESIGVGVPGTIRRGVIHHARNLAIESYDLEAAITAETDAPVRVSNDVNAAALGAWALRGGASTSLAYLNLGTGMAAGLVLDGRAWEGGRGMAGEIGYISADPNGPTHVEGLAGTLEGYASGSGVVGQWGVEGASAVDVFDAADAGDARAIAIRDGVYFGAASAVRVLALTFGADTIVIGGGLAGLGRSLCEGMAEHFDAWSRTSPLIASLQLDAITHLLDDERPTHAIGAAIMGGHHG